MKKNSHQWEENGGNGGKGRNGEEEGGKGLLLMLLGQDYGHETRIKSFTLYFRLQRGRCKRGKHMYYLANMYIDKYYGALPRE